MRVFLLILIAIVVGSAAGSMASWFLLATPQPVAVAVANANAPAPVPENVALAVPANDEEKEAREAILREAEARSKEDAGVLAQQARRSETLKEQVQDAPPVTAALEPSSVDTATDPNATNAAVPVARPKPSTSNAAEPVRESPNYVMPIAIGLIAGIIALIVANRVVSQDI